MNEGTLSPEKPAWTWADQISTYRFWGILLFFFFSALSLGILTTFLPILLRETLDLPLSQGGVPSAVLAVGGVFGFYLAWATARYRAKALLIAAGVMQLCGVLLLTIPGLAAVPALRYAGAFLTGLAAGAIALAVPSVLAAGRGGAEAFVVAFGLLFTVSRIGSLVAPASIGRVLDAGGYSLLTGIIPGWLVLGLLFLLPVKASLFQGAPGPRGHALSPTHRNPWVVGLLSIINLYSLYWLYRAHGEVRTMAPSRAILSPRGAVVAGLFVILLYPVMLASLADALNQGAVARGGRPARRPWVIALWAILFAPVAAGLLQSSMNRAMEAPPGIEIPG
jgi:hypothetical protein